MPADITPDRNKERTPDRGKDSHDYDYVKQLTASSLQKLIETTDQLTHLSLPERTALIDEIARIIPAGNVPSLVAAGLPHLPGGGVSLPGEPPPFFALVAGVEADFLQTPTQHLFRRPR